MRRNIVLALGTAAALACATVALAQVQDRFKVASDPNAAGYPASLHIVIDSPPDYVREFIGRGGNDAEWRGPHYQATGLASLGGDAGLGWSAGIYKTPSNRQTIIDNLVHDWKSVAEGAEPIEQRIGGREVGTLPGTWVLTQGSFMDGEARYEAGLVFPLCGRTALLNISALTPASDSAGGAMGFGEYRIRGMAPTAWNRQQILLTINGISVDGSLPAFRISARASGRRISGAVADCNGRPVAGVPTRLERRSGRRWAPSARGRTTAAGRYSLRAKSAGIYRVVVGARRSSAVSVK